MKQKSCRIILNLSLALIFTFLTTIAYANPSQKIHIRDNPDVPVKVKKAKTFLPFRIKSESLASYKNRQQLSRLGGLDYVEDHYVVLFKDNVFPYEIKGNKNSLRRIRQLVSSEGQALQEVVEELVSSVGGEVIDVWEGVVEGFSAYIPESGIKLVQMDPRIASVERDSFTAFSNAASWGIDRIDQYDLPLNDLYLPAKTGAGVHIYILDSGLRVTHNEFAGRVGNGYYTSNFSSVDDTDGHGTGVAGIAAGETLGVAPQAIVHPVKVIDGSGGTDTDFVAGLNWIKNNAIHPAVCNISLKLLSGSKFAVNNALNSLHSSGVACIVAAGNDGVDVNLSSVSPANATDAYVVGATTSGDGVWIWSNEGWDILAPGVGIITAHPYSDVATISETGTSFAAPHVTGVAAHYLQDNPTASAYGVHSGINIYANGTSSIYPIPAGNHGRFVGVLQAGFSRPPAPSNATINVNGQNFTLTWNDEAWNETNYVIEHSPNLSTWTTFATVFANVESYTDVLPAGVSFFRIYADSFAGNGLAAHAAPGGSTPPPGSETIYSSDGAGDIYYNYFDKYVTVPSGGIASAYVSAESNSSGSYASAEVSGQGEYIYASASESYEYYDFVGGSDGTYYLFAEHMVDYGSDTPEAEAHIEW